MNNIMRYIELFYFLPPFDATDLKWRFRRFYQNFNDPDDDEQYMHMRWFWSKDCEYNKICQTVIR